MIFQTVPIDQVGRSLKAVSRGALTGLGLGPGLQVAAQGAPKVVLGAMSLSPLPSWVQMCPGLVAAASTKVQKHVPSYGFPPPCKQAALGTSHLGTSHQIHTPPPPSFCTSISGSVGKAQPQQAPMLPRQRGLSVCGHLCWVNAPA